MVQSYSIKGNNFQGLILLWALGEAGLGGLIHAMGVPITGLVVGGWAAVCLCLMAYRGAKGMDFIHALIQVLIVKAVASPHSPLPAYLAVSFQGLLAALIFGRIPWAITAVLFPILTMIESAAQKLLTVTLFFGQPFWDGMQAMTNKVAQGFSLDVGDNAVWWIAICWVLLHGLFGLGISIWIIRLPQSLSQLNQKPLMTEEEPDAKPASKTLLGGAFIIIMPLLVLCFLPLDQAIYGIIRAWAALLLWFTLGRWLTRKLQQWLSRKKDISGKEVSGILGALPHYRKLAAAAWKRSNETTSGINRWNLTAMLLLKEGLKLDIIAYEQPGNSSTTREL